MMTSTSFNQVLRLPSTPNNNNKLTRFLDSEESSRSNQNTTTSISKVTTIPTQRTTLKTNNTTLVTSSPPPLSNNPFINKTQIATRLKWNAVAFFILFFLPKSTTARDIYWSVVISCTHIQRFLLNSTLSLSFLFSPSLFLQVLSRDLVRSL